MLKQKPNEFMLPMIAILVITLAVLSLFLVRTVSNLINDVSDNETIASTSATMSEPFDYTRDRDQYEVAYVAASEPFDYTHDRDQYETSIITASEPFDYSRDSNQYWQPVTVSEPFDYTRDRDQYWQ